MTSKLSYPPQIPPSDLAATQAPMGSPTIKALQVESAVSDNPRIRDQFRRAEADQIRTRTAPPPLAPPSGGGANIPPLPHPVGTSDTPGRIVPQMTPSLSDSDSVPLTDAPVRGTMIEAALPQGPDHALAAGARPTAPYAETGPTRQFGSQTATRPGR